MADCDCLGGIKNTFLYHIIHVNFFIHHLTIMTILTQYQNIRGQTNTFEMLRTILTHMANVKDQTHNLPKH